MQIEWDKEQNTISVGKAVFGQYYNFKDKTAWVKSVFSKNGIEYPVGHPKKKNKEITDVLKCSSAMLYNHFNKLQYKVFVVPHKELLSKIVFSRRIDVKMLSKIVEHKPLLAQAWKDGQHNILPIIAHTGMSPKQLKETYKSAWKVIAKNSLNKNKVLSKNIRPELYAHYCSLPTTLLQEYGAARLDVLRYIENNFKGKWGKRHALRGELNIFRDAADMAEQLGKTVSSDWTPRRVKEEHDKLSSELLARRFSPEPIEALSNIPVTTLSYEGFTATLLMSAKDIAEEGKAMGHCVAGYVESVRSGDYLVYSVRTPDGERSSTLGIHVRNNTDGKISYVFSQHYGKYNKRVSVHEELTVAHMAMEELNA